VIAQHHVIVDLHDHLELHLALLLRHLDILLHHLDLEVLLRHLAVQDYFLLHGVTKNHTNMIES